MKANEYITFCFITKAATVSRMPLGIFRLHLTTLAMDKHGVASRFYGIAERSILVAPIDGAPLNRAMARLTEHINSRITVNLKYGYSPPVRP